MDAMEVDGQPDKGFDEQLYSRQAYAIGADAQVRLGRTDVMVCGMTGLGLELAKNIILTGVRSVTLVDSEPVSFADLSSGFYFTKDDVGVNRADACLAKLQELNKYVKVTKLPRETLTPEDLSQWRAASVDAHPQSQQVVVFVDKLTTCLKPLNAACRAHGVKFIACESRGLASCIFVDNGPQHTVYDPDGEEIKTLLVVAVGAQIQVHDDNRHELSDGDTVMFTDLPNFPELHNTSFDAPNPNLVQVKVTGPFTFTLEKDGKPFDCTRYKYVRGGYVTKVRQPAQMVFRSLEDSMREPEFLLTDFAKMDAPGTLHLLFLALHEFHKAHNHMPGPHNNDHADEVVGLAREHKKSFPDFNLDEPLIHSLAKVSSGNLNPMATMVGGFAAHEVLKAASGKFTPINQWFYFDARECLLNPAPSPETCQPQNSRYDGEIAVFGTEFVQRLQTAKMFVVGSGALGCEFLKNFAMMGVGCSAEGAVIVTDMDGIEKSNLSRQFLFRPKDIGQLKSKVAAEAAKAMNPDLSVKYLTEKVAPETENVFDDSFWESLDAVTNALDNIQARLYVDSRCVYYHKPLLESGTLGSKGNVQVVMPRLTEAYGTSRDPPEKTFPVCTLKNFPNAIEHTIQWARDSFGGFFTSAPRDANGYLTDDTFLAMLEKEPSTRTSTLQTIKDMLITEKPSSFADCVRWARARFDELFCNSIKTLLYNFPLDTVTNSGELFWSGAKRPPTPLEFDASDPTHALFVHSAANLRAFLFKIPGCTDMGKVMQEAASIPSIPFVPKKVKIQVEENEKVEASNVDASPEELEAQLPPRSSVPQGLAEAEFEKDDDTNFHVDFITACSNLRARNYAIPEADRNKTKQIAGKIIPAMVTTTALITGLVCLEVYKVLQKGKKVDDFKNAFVNLAIPFVTLSEPMGAPEVSYGPKDKPIKWTLWDRFDIDEGKDITLQQLLDLFESKYNLEVSMLSAGPTILYTFFQKQSEKSKRLKMKMADLVEMVSKTKIGDNVRFINIEICADYNGEAAEVPSVRYKFR
ncbi:Ubiquitin-like modifier-activating enzyme 1 [Diplonema papillatum]|nr:Ubiquitin-like modifier-activating enzyme 1 [Diplonema papillatum]